MQRLKLLFLALAAVAALSAFLSAAAWAEDPSILPEGVASEKFTGEGGIGVLAVLPGGLGNEIEAKSLTAEGTIENGGLLGSFHIDFKGIKVKGLAIACTGLGEAAETVLVLGTYHMVYDKLGVGAALGVAVLFLVNSVHFSCATELKVVSGEVLCLIKPINTLGKHFELICEGASGDPTESTYWDEKGVEHKIPNGLLTATNEGAGVMSSVKVTALLLTTKEVLIMG